MSQSNSSPTALNGLIFKLTGFRSTIFLGLMVSALPLAGQENTKPANPQPKKESNSAVVSAPAEQIQAELKRILKEYHLPGMVAGYQTMGQPMVIAAAGFRKHKSPEPITVDDKVHLGSCTKAITSTMIARLIDRGEFKTDRKLTWETTIKEGLPELSAKLDPGYAEVTLRQLLMHRGGCNPNGAWNMFSGKPTITETRRAIVARAMLRPPKQPPGEFVYSNLGYVVASLMATRATGMTWEELMQQEIFDPLELKTAGFGPPGAKKKIEQPWGHVPLGTLKIPRQGDNPPALGPAGTVHMSLSDWAKFCLAHAIVPDKNEQAAEPIRLVKQSTLDFLHTPPGGLDEAGNPKNYALGWGVVERNWGGKVLLHSGSNTMWMASVYVSQKNQSVYLSVTNVGGEAAGRGVNAIFETLIELEEKARGGGK